MQRLRKLGVYLVAGALLRAGTPPDKVFQGGSAATVAASCDTKLVTWNIERGQQLAAVTAALERLAPSVALLQEVDVHAARTGRKHVAEELARKLGMNYLFAPEFDELGQGQKGKPAYHGQAILTAWHIASARMLRFRQQTDYWQPRWFLPNWALLQRRDGGRLALAAELGTGPRRMVVYDVHLESRGPEDLRLRQIEDVLADVHRYPADTPIVIAGDLNTRRPDPPATAALVKAGFRKAMGQEVTTTHGTALDWVFVRGPLVFAEGTIHRSIQASDHFPLSVRIRWERPVCP
jgi:endonuclease/exonuclease/phosphatase family metal-dependent hydrolase